MTGDKTLTLGSLFDGSGGFPLAGILAGVTPLWASEIEPFAVRVTTARLPQMQHYGDVSALSGADLPPVDIITFGSPCQDMSIAGKRGGLDGSRSSLFYEAIRIVKEILHSRKVSSDISSLVKGVMVESYIEPGNQKIGCHPHIYGKSITDPCLGWNDSKELVYTIADLC